MPTGAEAELIGALFSAPHLMECMPVTLEHFYDPRYRALFEVLQVLAEQGTLIVPEHGGANGTLICDELQKRDWGEDDAIDFVSNLMGLFPGLPPDLDLVLGYAEEVRERHAKRELSRKIAGVLAEIQDPMVKLTDNVARLGELTLAAQLGVAETRDPTSDGILWRLIERVDKGVPPSFSTGLQLIDDNLAWHGFAPEQVWVVVNRYKGYKSRLVMAMADAALAQEKRVAYIALEDNDEAFSTQLVSSHFGIPTSAFVAYYGQRFTPYLAQIQAGFGWFGGLKDSWRVYDRRHGISDWRRFAPLVMADKRKYGLDLLIVDHLQLWSRKYEVLSDITNMLMDVAAQAEIALLVISQVSNENIKDGSPEGSLPTKGTGDLGAVAHVGLEMYKPEDSDFTADNVLIAKLSQAGMAQYLGSRQLVAEVGVKVKIARHGSTGTVYTLFEPYSGKLLYHQMNPEHMEEWK
jgi:replicative DNA helicase